MKLATTNWAVGMVGRMLGIMGLQGPSERGRVAGRRLQLEQLESRLVPASTGLANLGIPSALLTALSVGSSSPVGYAPAQIEDGYDIGKISFSGPQANGQGQTIAIVDAYNDPDIGGDLAAFDSAFGIPAPPSFKVYNQSGTNITSQYASNTSTKIVNGVPGVDSGGSWEGEEALDVEWAHALAFDANIIVVEANGSDKSDYLAKAVPEAASLPGVSVVSMSYGIAEFSSETSYDQYFVTPTNHIPVTFVASSGDDGAPGDYPAYSPNVVAVGGTSLSLIPHPPKNDTNNYISETGWGFYVYTNLEYGYSHNSTTGTWAPEPGGASGVYGVASPGNNTSTWSDTIPKGAINGRGDTEVSATWTPNSANATNATYSIYDGTAATGKLLATVQVNQRVAPVGSVDNGSAYQELGDFDFTTGTVTVVLNAGKANGKVVADAVGLGAGGASGGGISQYEAQPIYQELVDFGLTKRTIPDVSFDAASGVTVYNSYGSNGLPWFSVGGTSLSAPCWGALFAIYDQGRVLDGLPTLSTEQALDLLYLAPNADFHDITSGYNGHEAGPYYDLVTGIGTPIANLLTSEMLSNLTVAQLNTIIEIEHLAMLQVEGNMAGQEKMVSSPGDAFVSTNSPADLTNDGHNEPTNSPGSSSFTATRGPELNTYLPPIGNIQLNSAIVTMTGGTFALNTNALNAVQGQTIGNLDKDLVMARFGSAALDSNSLPAAPILSADEGSETMSFNDAFWAGLGDPDCFDSLFGDSHRMIETQVEQETGRTRGYQIQVA